MLAPSRDLVRAQLGTLFSAHVCITAAAIALRSTNVSPPVSPPPWFDALAAALSRLQDAAGQWLQNDGPTCIAGLTQPFKGYQTRFATVFGQLRGSDQAEVIGRLQWLDHFLADQVAMAQALQKTMADAAAGFRGGVPALRDAVAAARADLRAEREDIATIEAQISQLMADVAGLNEDSSNEMRGMGFSGIGAGGGLAIYKVLPALGRYSEFPALGSVLALVQVGLAAGAAAKDQQAIQDKLALIRDLSVKISEDQQKAVALSGLIQSVEAAARLCSAARVEAAVHGIWQEVQADLEAIVARLQRPGVTLAAFNEADTLDQAMADWTAIANAAEAVQEQASGLAGADPG